MSYENRQLLAATIYNLSSGSADLFRELGKLTDDQLETVLNEILKGGENESLS